MCLAHQVGVARDEDSLAREGFGRCTFSVDEHP